MNQAYNKNESHQKFYKKYSCVFVCLMAVFYAGSVLFAWCKPEDVYSQSERRLLAAKPALEAEELWTGKYVSSLEKYMVDQFPLRDELRSLKSNFSIDIMQKKDTHSIFVKDGYLCKMEYPMDEDSILHATQLFETIYSDYLKDTQVRPYITIVPDKNYFPAEEEVLAMDYEEFFAQVYGNTPHLTPLPVAEYLQLTDYYRTDTHWKQEAIIDVAEVLAAGMDVPFHNDFTVNQAKSPFYGVYYGRAGLDLPPDVISYCTSGLLDSCLVYDYENDKEIPLYNMEALMGRDPYEMFLGGNISLASIENPEALSDKELVVFGDSFSRSLLPLLAGSYSRITLVDIRYIPSARIGNHIEFSDQDVLFLYSTSVLNESITLK